MKILICNDDGVHARGLHVLHQSLKRLGKVWVVAPMTEMSTTGHSLTLHKPLRIQDYGKKFYGVSGSPADCINLGIKEIMPSRPDIVVSGINRGANLGQDVYYSGTVSAAREAAMMGIFSIAVSLVIDYKKPKKEERLYYKTAAELSLRMIKKFHRDKRVPKGTVLNLNVPDLPRTKLKGVRLSHQGFRHYSGGIWKRKDHRGNDYFWVGGTYEGFRNEKGTDCFDAKQGYATLTPLELDCTDHDYLNELREGW